MNSSCAQPVNLEHALMVERHHAECFLAERVVPGAEVHRDRDITWVVHDGQAWRNAGIMVRFSSSSAGRRLDMLLGRYERHGRGVAFWISPSATPGSLPDLLGERGLRCRKYFPAMVRQLSRQSRSPDRAARVTIRPVVDLDEFTRTPHPSIGPLTTSLRRIAFDRLRALLSARTSRTRAFVAWLDEKPVGGIEIFLGSEAAGIHGLSVLERYRGRGIGSALVEHACADALRSGAKAMVLLATSEGERVYARRGFVEVARFAYWYRSFQRGR